jgi:deoxyhypusine synthase
MISKSMFEGYPDIIPPSFSKRMTITDLVDAMGKTCFEARNVFRGARLFRKMIDDQFTIWLGIAGAGIAGGMGGIVVSLLEAGFIDVICSTGAQVYHDLHFAFGLPVKAISPSADDNELKRRGDTRIYDICIREKETLEAQDKIIRDFVKEYHADRLSGKPLSSWEFNLHLGAWVLKNSKHPERSFVAQAAKLGVPVFWDSMTNHSISLNLIMTDRDGFPVSFSAQKDIFDSAAIAYGSRQTGFVELGGGGPKNFIQQTGPTIGQILQIEYEGAEKGLQISTASEREGSLSGCTFGEAVTWGKYHSNDEEKLVQIWGEYSIIFPLLAAYVLENCQKHQPRNTISQIPFYVETLEKLL